MIKHLCDVRYFPKGLFPSGNFPRVISQVATFKMCNFPSGNFPNIHFPNWQFPKLQLPHKEKAATSQMYIFPNDNFSSGNFPMKEKRQLPKCTSSQLTISLNNLLYLLSDDFPCYNIPNVQFPKRQLPKDYAILKIVSWFY